MYEFLINSKKVDFKELYDKLNDHPALINYDDVHEALDELLSTGSVEVKGDVFQINEVLVCQLK